MGSKGIIDETDEEIGAVFDDLDQFHVIRQNHAMLEKARLPLPFIGREVPAGDLVPASRR